jgi:hypothetical protein
MNKHGTRPHPDTILLGPRRRKPAAAPAIVNADIGEPPADLGGAALAFWFSFVEERRALGLLTATDRPLLSAVCRLISRVELGKGGLTTIDVMRRLLSELAVTPVTRAKLPRPAKVTVQRAGTAISRELDRLVPGSARVVAAEFSRGRREEQDNDR